VVVRSKREAADRDHRPIVWLPGCIRRAYLSKTAESSRTGTWASGLKDLTLDTRIPAADRQKYRSIRDAKDWENPYLVVLKSGLDVRARGYRKTVPASALRRVLVELPVSAWPYGAVVAVQEVHLRAVGGADDAAIKANLSETLAALRALEVLADLWP
jgi:hypothetical protein